MKEQELQQLSKDVAVKYGIDDIAHGVYNCYGDEEDGIWLHNDSERCFDLMVQHDVDVEPANNSASSAYIKGKKKRTFVDALHANHNNDKHLATRVAILKALLAKD